MSSPGPSARGAIVTLGAALVGLAALFAHGQPWIVAAALLIGAWTLLLAWLAGRPARAASGAGPTYAIWGRWDGRGWARFRAGLGGELMRAGYQPASRRAVPDILICGPGAPRLAGWTPRRVARRVVGVLPERAASPEPARWAASLLQRRSWDAVVYLGLDGARPSATLVDARGEEIRVAGRADGPAFLHALARLLIAQARGGDAGAAGF